jgi:hypothetical protein
MQIGCKLDERPKRGCFSFPCGKEEDEHGSRVETETERENTRGYPRVMDRAFCDKCEQLRPAVDAVACDRRRTGTIVRVGWAVVARALADTLTVS